MYRCTLGNAIAFRYIGLRDTFPVEEFTVKFGEPLSIQTVQHGRKGSQVNYGQYDLRNIQLREVLPIADGGLFHQKDNLKHWLSII